MLVELFNFFSDSYGPLRVFDYLSFRAIFATLRKTKNNRTKASKILEISVRTLRNKLNLYKEKDLLPSEFILGDDGIELENKF